MNPADEMPVYQRIGEDGIARMVAAFYRRVPSDPILGPMYPATDLAGAEHRLREFLVYRLGGPPRYIQERGHPRLRMRHMPFPIDTAARDRWLQLMAEAMAEAAVPAEDAAWLGTFFADIADFLRNRPG